MRTSLHLAIKRLCDVVISALGLALLAPLLVAIAIAIRIASRGPILFSHVAAGRNGKPFTQWKFRTMTQEAGRNREPFEISKSDPRITAIGRVLRRWSLDELPQLWNVLRGDMSLIGPRPNFAETAARYSNYEMRRLAMRPGLTGWAQVHGRNLIPWHQRIPLDIEYVENHSLWLDLKIAIQTISVWFRGEGLYGPDGFVRSHILSASAPTRSISTSINAVMGPLPIVGFSGVSHRTATAQSVATISMHGSTPRIQEERNALSDS